MKLSIIAAMTKDRIIGENNAIPWHLPADFFWFKLHTIGKPVIMGRKTFESIGKPLPSRRNIVITSNENFPCVGTEVVTSIDAALALVEDEKESMIIGGSSIYRAFLPLVQRLYLTFIDAKIDGDRYFPDWGKDWIPTLTEQHLADESNAYNMEFVILERYIYAKGIF